MGSHPSKKVMQGIDEGGPTVEITVPNPVPVETLTEINAALQGRLANHQAPVNRLSLRVEPGALSKAPRDAVNTGLVSLLATVKDVVIDLELHLADVMVDDIRSSVVESIADSTRLKRFTISSAESIISPAMALELPVINGLHHISLDPLTYDIVWLTDFADFMSRCRALKSLTLHLERTGAPEAEESPDQQAKCIIACARMFAKLVVKGLESIELEERPTGYVPDAVYLALQGVLCELRERKWTIGNLNKLKTVTVAVPPQFQSKKGTHIPTDAFLGTNTSHRSSYTKRVRSALQNTELPPNTDLLQDVGVML